MKKLFYTILTAVLLLSATACGAEPTATPNASATPSTSAKPSASVTPDIPSTPTTMPTATPEATPTPDNTTVVGDFEVGYTLHTYEKKRLAIVHVKYNGDTPCTLTLKGKYLNAKGEETGSETKVFEGFPAGWSNYFVFRPEKTFTEFDYEISTTAYQGEIYADHIFPYKGGYEILIDTGRKLRLDIMEATADEVKKAKSAYVKMGAYNTYGSPLTADMVSVLFDNDGKVFFVAEAKMFNLGGIANPYLGFGPICGDGVDNPAMKDFPEISGEVAKKLENFTDYTAITGIINIAPTVLDWDGFYGK